MFFEEKIYSNELKSNVSRVVFEQDIHREIIGFMGKSFLIDGRDTDRVTQ